MVYFEFKDIKKMQRFRVCQKTTTIIRVERLSGAPIRVNRQSALRDHFTLAIFA